MNTLPEDLDCRWWTDNLVGALQDSWSRFFTGYSLQNENSSGFISMAFPVGRSKVHAEDYRGTKQRNKEPDESGRRAGNAQTLQTRVDVESVLPVGGVHRKWRSVCGKGTGDRALVFLVPLSILKKSRVHITEIWHGFQHLFKFWLHSTDYSHLLHDNCIYIWIYMKENWGQTLSLFLVKFQRFGWLCND